MLKFSVLVSVYFKDNPEFLSDALESLFTQSLLPTEIVLVKDGKLTDSLERVINLYVKRDLIKIVIISLNENLGLGKALSIGINSCNYDLIARMDADDICVKTRFQIQIEFLSKNIDVSVVGANVEEFNNRPGDLSSFRTLPSDTAGVVSFAKFRNPINHPTVVFRKEDVIAAGSYKHMPLFEDYYLWVRMLVMGYKITNIDEVLLNFRVGNNMIGRRHGLSYVQKEISFLKAIRRIGFITTIQYAESLIAKMPLRLMPLNALKFIYKIFLR
ncbi:glycosyltransferase [Pedobacter sp. MW01-1-1]|uniref:glycosyltransferase n=1 Tax=Pedobacter sp. MW01-1-1 TaxID=3383027 RepID=UPI003FEFCD85